MKMYACLWAVLWIVSPVIGLRSPIWPQPLHIHLGNSTLWLDNSLAVNLRCDNQESVYWSFSSHGRKGELLNHLKRRVVQTLSLAQQLITFYLPQYFDKPQATEAFSEAQILRAAVHEAANKLHTESFVPWKFHKRHSQFEPDDTDAGSVLSTLSIFQWRCPLDTSFEPNDFFKGDESYEIRIQDSTATINTKSTLGTLRALQSITQLFYAHSTGKGVYTPLAPVRIFDYPLWPHRGLSLDIARNAFLPEDAMRTIDGLAAVKMSRLHLHATDSQSWPLEIPSLPDLARKGAYQPELVWSTEDLESVQRYGASRGIMVFLELDMPGHTGSVAHAYPDLIAAFNELDWSTFAAEPQSGQLKLDSDEIRKFLNTLFEDLLPRLSMYSSLYHFGGDEVNKQVHLLDETVRSNETKVLKPLIQKLMDQVLDHVQKNSLRPVVWEEMVLDWELDMHTSRSGHRHDHTLVQVWRDYKRIQEVLEKGHSVIFGDYKHWYLDCGFGQFLDPFPSGVSPPGVPFNTSGGRPSRLDPQFLDYCQPYHNWRTVYTFNPLEGVSEHLHKGIEGGEVLMWSEQTDPIDLDFKLWPRTAAAAEVLWSGPREPKQIADAAWRLGHLRERLVNRGIASSPVHMTWCLMEGGCEF